MSKRDTLDGLIAKAEKLCETLETKQTAFDDAITAKKKEYENVVQDGKDALEAKQTAIEGLLPGATAVGLAAFYHEEQQKYTQPIKAFNRYFVIAVLCIPLAVFTFGYFDINLEVTDNAYINLILRYSITFPFIWIASFLAKRRAENKKIQQEYVHKEAMAKIFIGFKDSVNDLEEGKATDLAARFIATIDRNPSKEILNEKGFIHAIIKLLNSVKGVKDLPS